MSVPSSPSSWKTFRNLTSFRQNNNEDDGPGEARHRSTGSWFLRPSLSSSNISTGPYRRYNSSTPNASSSSSRKHPHSGAALYRREHRQQESILAKRSPSNHPASSFNNRVTPPFLSLATIKLEESLPAVLRHLAVPTQESVSIACDLLDSSVATASPSSSNKSSPASSSHYPNNSSPQTTSGGSPLLSWLSQGANNSPGNTAFGLSSSPTSSALALQGEWETYVGPIWLLAAAEVLTADLQPIHQLAALQGLYQRCHDDLMQTRQVLCGPVLRSNPLLDNGNNNPDLLLSDSSHEQDKAARSLAATLSILATTVCLNRIHQLQWMHAVRARRFSPHLCQQAVQALTSLVWPEDLEESAAAAAPLVAAVKRDVDCFCHMLRACLALEQCHFLQAIVNLRLWQNHLPAHETSYVRWLKESHQTALTWLPLYFDRVQAYSQPLYGHSVLPLSPSSLETRVTDFLRKQDKAGGPPTAVALVLDAASTANVGVERGFWWSADDKDGDGDLRALWPAVYMRSTMHALGASSITASLLASGSTSGSALGSTSLLSQSGGGAGGSKTRSSQTSLLSTWSSSDNARHNTSSSASPQGSATWRLLEYGPDTGKASSWPHTDWSSLVALIDTNFEEDAADLSMEAAPESPTRTRFLKDPVAFTHREEINDDDEEEDKRLSNDTTSSSLGEVASLLGATQPHETESPSRGTSEVGTHPPSTFHVVSVSDWLSFVVMVKGEPEERTWRRRRSKSKVTDEEIRDFLNGMAEELRVGRLFVEVPSPSKRRTLSLDSFQAQSWNDDDHVQAFLKDVKESFGLRPVNPLAVPVEGRSRGFPLSPKKAPPNSVKRRRRLRMGSSARPSLQESADAFFLGSDLAHLFRDD